MKIGAQTIHALRSIAMGRTDYASEHPLTLSVEEARELYESYTSARMYEQAQEHHARQKAAAETREAALETRVLAAETKLAAAEKKLAAFVGAELRGAETLIPSVVCTCGHTAGERLTRPDCPSHRGEWDGPPQVAR